MIMRGTSTILALVASILVQVSADRKQLVTKIFGFAIDNVVPAVQENFGNYCSNRY